MNNNELKKWIDFDINIPEHKTEDGLTSFYLQCPCCPEKRRKKDVETLFIDLKTKQWFCKHCGWAGNLIEGVQKYTDKDNVWSHNPFLDINRIQLNNDSFFKKFSSHSISKETLKHFKVGFIPDQYIPVDCTEQSVAAYPYFHNGSLVNIVYSGKYLTSEYGGIKSIFNYDAINNETTYITLNELELLSLYEAGITNVISLFGGISMSKPDSHFRNMLLDTLSHPEVERRFKKVNKFIIALPNKEQSTFLIEELVRRLGKEKCWIIQPPMAGYTWNTILQNFSKEGLRRILNNAKAPKIRGILEVDDVEDQIDSLFEQGMTRGASTGFDTLDEYYTVVPGQWTVVTGVPGHGKSNVLDHIMVNLAKYSGWRFGIFSPENQPTSRHFASIMEKYAGQPFDKGRPGRMTEDKKDEAKRWVKDHFSVILPHEDDSWSLEGILDLAKSLVYRKGIKGLVIDPWNEIDHNRENNMSETEYISKALTTMRNFARIHQVHIWLVAHPAKLYKDKDGKYPVPTPYDIAGSAHFRNKADNAITVWRNAGRPDQTVADVHVQKIRYKEVGKLGRASLRFDPPSGCFIDDIDQDLRANSLENDLETPTEELIRKI